jgi:uncharacterized protein YegJ (DUF2314 family)
MWEPATNSAVKKATKLLQQHQQKQKRAEELRQRDEADGAAKREAELKRLEDAKKIVLAEPTEKATKIKIKQAVEKRGERVKVFGWVHRLRSQGGMIFIVLRDGTGYIQCVLTGDLVSTRHIARFLACERFVLTRSLPPSRARRPRRTTLSPSLSSPPFRSPDRSTSCPRARPPSTTTSSPLTGGPSSARLPEETTPSPTRSPRYAKTAPKWRPPPDSRN